MFDNVLLAAHDVQAAVARAAWSDPGCLADYRPNGRPTLTEGRLGRGRESRKRQACRPRLLTQPALVKDQ